LDGRVPVTTNGYGFDTGVDHCHDRHEILGLDVAAKLAIGLCAPEQWCEHSDQRVGVPPLIPHR